LASQLHEESIFIDQTDHKLHLKRFYKQEDSVPCLLLHGSIENGKIFYSKSGKGLGPYLAQNGFDVFIADLRGRGDSKPAVDKKSSHDQRDAILNEIPAFLEKVNEIKGNQPIHLMAHSWGGVLILSYLARYKPSNIKSLVFFGTKRRIDVINFDSLWRIYLLWDKVGGLLSKFYGYLPAKEYRFGSDNEPVAFYKQVKKWAIRGKWIDQTDGFDYGKELLKLSIPPTLYLTGSKDTHMGHKDDVKRLMHEVGNNPQDKFILLSRDKGFSLDYNHINILTHPNAREDHFPLVIKWVKEHS